MGSYSSEQLEEGEIVDDDDFEDISDNSIIEPNFGKFVSSNEHLRALSLSSDSETELCKKRKKKLLVRKNRIRRQKKRKRHRTSSESSETDVPLSPDLKGKLKEAVHISGIDEGQKNPLEARLKAMGLKVPQTAPPEDPPKKVDSQDEDKVDDHELEELRIEALKTAVLNKFQRRKRKKAVLEEQKDEQKALGTQENKENDTPKDQSEKTEAKEAALDLEEDEDVLRASLLAGLAKKITKIQPVENVIPVKPAPLALPVRIAPVLPKKTTVIKNAHNVNNVNKNKVIQNRPKPQVKPLIINVNADSDSEEETKQKVPEPPKVDDLKVIANNVEKFLKEQRAKFETETKKRFQIVNKNNKSILEKSAVKLLPKSQQIEYQQLLRKLKNAERKKKARKIALQKLKNAGAQKIAEQATAEVANNAQVVSKPLQPDVQITVQPSPAINGCAKATVKTIEKVDGVVQTCDIQVVVKQPVVEVKSSGEEFTKSEDDKRDTDSEKRKSSGVTNELTTLQKTLKEIKMQRNGSLQIKSKYQVLTPIIRKITSASNERKKQEQRIKHLLQELNEARNNLSKSHQKFSALVRELVVTKEKIDSSTQEAAAARAKTPSNNNKQNGLIIKEGENGKKIERCVDNDRNKGSGQVLLTSTPIKDTKSPIREEPAMSSITTNNDYEEDMDVCNSDETDVCQIDIVDPNDIDQIFTRKTVIKQLPVPEYVSPLNLNAYERYKHVDPHGIMCPYEVNGSCRDNDCTFKHYLKSHSVRQ